ncbi:uncharacterized protein DSM5745_01153 [Aspergillus mulundensis]|uniref:Uncharacterized protein n=1 Tax=Aspergillus mulundensis TaxID=1810919 RepID=A0A3D8T5W6_9EURO|nr:hypothetical protein DSM5745_01153 [Aspergillus mulundensis]RDW93831.1 hypothetical protein DSM5745_01153 [Aspergillus mulundensis]
MSAPSTILPSRIPASKGHFPISIGIRASSPPPPHIETAPSPLPRPPRESPASVGVALLGVRRLPYRLVSITRYRRRFANILSAYPITPENPRLQRRSLEVRFEQAAQGPGAVLRHRQACKQSASANLRKASRCRYP